MQNTSSDQEIPKMEAGWRRYVKGLIASEISTVTRYCDEVVQLAPVEGDTGVVLSLLDAPKKRYASEPEGLFEHVESRPEYPVVLLNANMNHEYDLEGTLAKIALKLPPFRPRGCRAL